MPCIMRDDPLWQASRLQTRGIARVIFNLFKTYTSILLALVWIKQQKNPSSSKAFALNSSNSFTKGLASPVDDKCCGEFIIFVCKLLKSPVLPRLSVMPVVNFWTINWSLHRMLLHKDDMISKLNTCSKWSSRSSRVECPRHPQLKRENHTDATSTTY